MKGCWLFSLNRQHQNPKLQRKKNSPTYAEVLKSSDVAPTAKKQQKPHNHAQTASKFGQDGKSAVNALKKVFNTDKIIHDDDRKPASCQHVTPENVIKKECGNEVFILHDSVLNGVQEKRLGRSYGFEAVKCKALNIEALEPAFQATLSNRQPPKAVVIHCGINNLRHQDPKLASKEFVQSVRNISSCSPTSKIIISQLTAVNNYKLKQKKDVFNAVVFSELIDDQQVSFINNDNLPQHALRDLVHPNKRGSSILAVNIGRHLHRMMWEKPRRPARHFNRANDFLGYYDWKGNFFPHSPFHFPTKWY